MQAIWRLVGGEASWRWVGGDLEASWRAISRLFGDELVAIMRRVGGRFGGQFGGELGVS